MNLIFQGIRLSSTCILKNVSNKVSTIAPYICYSKNTLQNINDTSTNIRRFNSENEYTLRTCTCGELREEHVGLNVTLSGWVEFQRLNKFIVLRDGYGQTQLIVDDKVNV